MFNLLYPISYLVCLIGLVLWFYFKDNKNASRQFSLIFLIAFGVYLMALAFGEATLSFKLLILARDLVILGAVALFFDRIRKNALLMVVAAIACYGLFQFVGFNMLYNTFPEIDTHANELDDTYELLVETKDGQVPESYAGLIQEYGLTIVPAFQPKDPTASRLDEFVLIGIPDHAEKKLKQIIRKLKRLTGTLHIEANEIIKLDIQENQLATPQVKAKHANDPMIAQQWGWDVAQGDQLQTLRTSGIKPRKRALIAILDTGVDANHEDLRRQFISSGAANDTDPVGHGTHCAGVAAAVSNNGIGVASLIPDSSWVQVTSIKVLNASGIGNQQTTIKGIIQAADNGADVISMSLGSISNDARQKAYSEAVKYANSKGAIVVAAAGNSNMNSKDYAPANAKGIITVSALDVNQHKASFSNMVQDVEYGIAAPGVRIMSTYPNQQYKEMNGTSMATPLVAGLIGLMKSINPDLKTADVYKMLNESGKEVIDGKKTGKMVQGWATIEKLVD
jgi:thermitase